MPRKVAAGLQGGYCGMAELVHGRAAQPGAAVTCGVQPDVPAPSRGGQGVRVSPTWASRCWRRSLSQPPQSRAACVTWWRSSITSPKAPPIRERTNSWFLGWVHARGRVSPFPISFSLRNLGMLPRNPAWGSGVHRGGRCWVTRGSCSLFPPSFAAKVHQFFPSFPRDTSSISTETTVPWACARLFAGMRRRLRDATGAGTATNDLLFPSGKAERRVMGRQSGVVVCPPRLGSRGMWHCRCLAPESAGCMRARQFCTMSAPGLCQGN